MRGILLFIFLDFSILSSLSLQTKYLEENFFLIFPSFLSIFLSLSSKFQTEPSSLILLLLHLFSVFCCGTGIQPQPTVVEKRSFTTSKAFFTKLERFRSNDSTHMADPIDRPQPNHRSQTNRKSLKYAFDAGFLSGAHPSDTPDADGDSASRSSSDSESSDSDGESSWLDDLAASFRVVSEFAMRAERDELEMAKAREASRLAAEKRRAELEAELTRVVVRTQLQVAASCAPRASLGRKRKRSDEAHDSSSSPRERAMLLSLLQCNLI